MPILRPLASAGKRACWLLMGLCLGLPALANEAPVSFNGTSISLEQALERALRSNPELAAVGRETEIASGARQQAGLIPNPDLSWSVEDTRQGNRQTSVSIAQPLELGGKRGARVEVAKRGSEIAWTQLEVRRAELRAQVRGAYYAALTAQERVRLAKTSLDLARRALQAADRRVKAGSISSVERVRAQVLADNAQLDLSQAELEQQRTYVQLSSTWDEPQPGFARVGTASSAPPTLRLAAQEVARGEAQVDLEKRQRIPNLTVSIGSKYDQTARDGRGERVNLIGLSMPLPLFDRNQGNIYAAQSRADQARDLQRATLLRLRSEAVQAYDQLRTSEQELALVRRDLLPGAQSALDSMTRGFEMGKFNFLDVLDAQRTLVGVRAQYVRALDAAAQARVSMERLLGEDIGHLGQ
ncbi:TolC family protein [Pseudomonas aeruginosa]|uniref:TolC family protein n=1 Tax=Pseudomonas aeruginosa TaxID=287 RepID=UPI00223887FB|nr:TolC family protein [Pseudomonas aeruginosa]MCW5370050.1 TolC family protein [Pseudomonas aeruginosa]